MFNMTLLSALSALAAAAAAIVWLTKISKQISDLGARVLESADIKKIIEAAEKAVTCESRMAGCENRTEQSEDKLSEHETRLSELGAKLEATEQMANRNGTGLAEASEKMASVESRIVGCESKTEQSENRLTELETKTDEFANRLEAIERELEKHAADLAGANQGTKVMTDKIQSLEEFQAVTEKIRNLIIDAFNDMQANIPPVEGCPETNVDTTEPQTTLQESEEGQEQQVQSTMGPWDN